MIKPVTVDFETMPIARRPAYPPEPVGVSIKYWGKSPKYYAWGHINGGNNCSLGQAVEALRKAWAHKDGVLFHNGRFDIAVACERLGLPMLDAAHYHDTLLLLYLDDPRRKTFKLKPCAEQLLDMPPEEQDAVADWLIKNQPVPGVRIQESKHGENQPGKFIAYAPGDLVGTYANGDVDRTEKLFEKLYGPVMESMGDAYLRERRLAMVLLKMEQRGVDGDLELLTADVERYTETLSKLEGWVCKQIDANISLKGGEFAQRLVDKGFADASKMGVTATGKLKADKQAFNEGVTDPTMAGVLRYHGALSTCLHTFMEPWHAMMDASGGFIYTTWNATRTTGDVGTTTGRLSSTPNFQNIPKTFNPLFKHETKDGLHPESKKPLAKAPFELPPLPKVRRYLKAPDNGIFIDRDYSQQELRILGHVEGGALATAYQENPWMDTHDYVKDLVNRMLGTNFSRKPIKNTNFGLIYGMGIGKLAQQSSVDVNTAKKIKDAILNLFPGLKQLYREMKRRAENGEPVWTWGGRRYYVEEPLWSPKENRWIEFDYKLLNVIIQGSAADCTKEAVINYDACGAQAECPLVLQVHDQLTAALPRANKKRIKEYMELMRSSMESVTFDVPMLSEGAVGYNWADLEDYDKAGKVIYAH